MANLWKHKITDADIAQKGVVSAPDRLTGTARENKMVFDRLVREAVRERFNDLIDALDAELDSLPAGGTGGTGASLTPGAATSLTGLLYGNGSRLSAKPLGAPGGAAAYDATKSALENKADRSEVLAALNGKADSVEVWNQFRSRAPLVGGGDNLLDNWYFGTGVIDQRAGRRFSGGAYQRGYTDGPAIDRWKLENAGGWFLEPACADYETDDLTESEPCLRIASSPAEPQKRLVFSQTVELRGPLRTNQLSISFLAQAGGFSSSSPENSFGLSFSSDNVTFTEAYGLRGHITNSEKWKLFTATFFVPTENGDAKYLRADITITPPQNTAADGRFPCTLLLRAAKLELGDGQTLARTVRRYGSEAWALNDPAPDPAAELLKCMRYQQVINSAEAEGCPIGLGAAYSGAGAVQVPYRFPIRMRSAPRVIAEGGFELHRCMAPSAAAEVDAEALYQVHSDAEGVILRAGAQVEANTLYGLYASGGKIIFDAGL